MYVPFNCPTGWAFYSDESRQMLGEWPHTARGPLEALMKRRTGGRPIEPAQDRSVGLGLWMMTVPRDEQYYRVLYVPVRLHPPRRFRILAAHVGGREFQVPRRARALTRMVMLGLRASSS